MLACRRLAASQDLEAFRSRYQARGRIAVEPAWLARQRVLGFFLGGELVAGFVESDELERSFLGLSPAERAGVLLEANGGRPDRAFEVCTLWMDEPCRRAPARHAQVWATLVLRATLARRSCLLVSAERDELSAVYQGLGGRLVWDSPSSHHPGHRNRIFAFSRRHGPLALARACGRSLRRAVRRRVVAPEGAARREV